jgi:hypothetical protein
MRTSTFALALLLGVVACGEGTRSTDEPVPPCADEERSECTVYGVVLAEPLTLTDALDLAHDLDTEPVAVFRADAVCVPAIAFTPGEDAGEVASRFAFVEGDSLADRRRTAILDGMAPQPEGLHITESYWAQWTAEWRATEADGVEIVAIAVYGDAAADSALAAADAIDAVVELPWGRSDSNDPSYPGELLIDPFFASGYLDPVPAVDC